MPGRRVAFQPGTCGSRAAATVASVEPRRVMSIERPVAVGDRHAIAIVGAGPRGTGLLERLAAGDAELLPDLGGGAVADGHLIDPCPAGAGPRWRRGQSPL